MRKSLVKLCEQCCVAVVSPEDSDMMFFHVLLELLYPCHMSFALLI